jgi:hypothetical protein
MRVGSRPFGLAVAVISAFAVVTNAGAATFVVNTTADTGGQRLRPVRLLHQGCDVRGGRDAAGDVIELQPGAHYLVTAVWTTPINGPIAYPQVTTPIIVNGHGATLERPGRHRSSASSRSRRRARSL